MQCQLYSAADQAALWPNYCCYLSAYMYGDEVIVCRADWC